MSPFFLLLLGIFIVLGGILLLRVHPFVALLVASLVIALLTPDDTLLRGAYQDHLLEVERVSESVLVLPDPSLPAGTVVLRLGADTLIRDTLVVTPLDNAAHGLQLPSNAPHQVSDVYLEERDYNQARSAASASAGARVATGFGRTCISIGILIAMAAIIGKCLLDSGGAQRVVASLSGLLGEKRTPAAFLSSGFILGIPVFFDTVFYLLVPLAKAMKAQKGGPYLLYVLAIVAGGTMAHSLVPPTPGPLFVASELSVDLGLMIVGGLIVGIFTISVGYFYAKWAAARWDIPLRPSADFPLEHLQTLKLDPARLPSLWLSLTPIILPVILIAGNTFWDMLVDADAYPIMASTLDIVGDKNVALILAALVAMALMILQGSRGKSLSGAIQQALQSGGVIILVTAAGGAFGFVLRQTGIAQELQSAFPGAEGSLLIIAFLITTLVRIAQGSATVAMITAVGVIAPLAASMTLPYHPLYLALAIGCGSKPVSWMNDSGFWIIGKMSGMNEAETLKTASVQIALMGVAGLVVTLLGAWLFPLT